ncbi:TetR family transcriptional regulator [Streptomyces sp. NPDC006971]|uniref:TetR family transcriptional regulator n=1 Tax=Streptomyces sp. NPDC006971 TaxID=3154784 RepID=UPI0033C8C457
MGTEKKSDRTRRRLIRAAAVEIDRNGYERATLARICRLADVSMGALTFHFASKSELADAVRADARALADARTEQVANDPSPALGSAVGLTVGLARLLEGEAVVRSAARLARDDPRGAVDWTAAWIPVVRELLLRADREGELRPGVDPDTVVALAACLLAGAEALARTPDGTAPAGAVDQLESMWRVVLGGAARTPGESDDRRQGSARSGHRS